MCPFSRTSINPLATCYYRNTAVKIPILLNDATWPLVIRQFRGSEISHKVRQKWEMIGNMALKGNRLEDTCLPGCDAVSFSKCFSTQCLNHQCQKVPMTWILNASLGTTGLRLTFRWRNSQGSVTSWRWRIWINSCNLWQWRESVSEKCVGSQWWKFELCSSGLWHHAASHRVTNFQRHQPSPTSAQRWHLKSPRMSVTTYRTTWPITATVTVSLLHGVHTDIFMQQCIRRFMTNC